MEERESLKPKTFEINTHYKLSTFLITEVS